MTKYESSLFWFRLDFLLLFHVAARTFLRGLPFPYLPINQPTPVFPFLLLLLPFLSPSFFVSFFFFTLLLMLLILCLYNFRFCSAFLCSFTYLHSSIISFLFPVFNENMPPASLNISSFAYWKILQCFVFVITAVVLTSVSLDSTNKATFPKPYLLPLYYALSKLIL